MLFAGGDLPEPVFCALLNDLIRLPVGSGDRQRPPFPGIRMDVKVRK